MSEQKKQNANYKTREQLAEENKKLKADVKQAQLDYKKLSSDIEELKKMFLQNSAPVQNTITPERKDAIIGKVIEEREYVEIPLTKRIKVISLTDGMLNLATGSAGSGALVYTFLRFGETKSISYSDVEKIIIYNNSFAQKGVFYICDDDVVAIHGLAEYYQKILDLEGMKNLLKHSNDDLKDIFSKMTPYQQEVVVGLILEKLNKKEPVDMNKVYVINDVLKTDITKRVYKEE